VHREHDTRHRCDDLVARDRVDASLPGRGFQRVGLAAQADPAQRAIDCGRRRLAVEGPAVRLVAPSDGVSVDGPQTFGDAGETVAGEPYGAVLVPFP